MLGAGSWVLGAVHWVVVGVNAVPVLGDVSCQLRPEERHRAKQTASSDSGVTDWGFWCPGDSTRGCAGTQGLPAACRQGRRQGYRQGCRQGHRLSPGCPQGRAVCPSHATPSPAPVLPICLHQCWERQVWELGLCWELFASSGLPWLHLYPSTKEFRSSSGRSQHAAPCPIQPGCRSASPAAAQSWGYGVKTPVRLQIQPQNCSGRRHPPPCHRFKSSLGYS